VVSHNADHARVANRNRRLVDATAGSKTRVDLINLACEVSGILPEGCGVGPRGDEVSSGHVVSTFERAGETVLVQYVALTAGYGYDTERFKAGEVARPGAHRLVASPRELLASVAVVSRPQRPVPFVESDDSLNTFKGTPRRPRRTRRQFMTQRCTIERVGGTGVSEEGTRVENV
jgi:hypothetical protein